MGVLQRLVVTPVSYAELDELLHLLEPLGLEDVDLEETGGSVSLSGVGLLPRGVDALGRFSARAQLGPAPRADWASIAAPVPGRARWFGPIQIRIGDLSPTAPGDQCIHLTPGSAFGTGLHPSTALMMEILEERRPKSLLDVGTGSGILGLAALELGADSVIGTELDRDAALDARRNIELNGWDDAFELSVGEQLPGRQFPMVVANILPVVLVGLASELVRNVASGGELWLSGFSTERVEEVSKPYRDLGMRKLQVRELEGWAAVELAPSW